MKRRQHSQSVESLIATFAERLFEAVERAVDVRTRILTTELLDVALAPPVASERATLSPSKAAPRMPAADATQGQADTAATDAPKRFAGPASRKRVRTPAGTTRTSRGQVPSAPPPSPEQQRRDSEFARLRALLKPTGYDDASPVGDTASAPAPLVVVDPPADPLRLLEAEIRDQAHGLAQLSPAACTARIAAWAGRVRSYEETSGNRVAADLMLDKLRVLARAMDAGRIEALNGSWRTIDWPSYVRTNEALAEARPEALGESLPQRSGEADYRDVWS